MSALAHRNPVGARSDRSPTPPRLDLEPAPGPSPESLRAAGDSCQVIELFPSARGREAARPGDVGRTGPGVPADAACEEARRSAHPALPRRRPAGRRGPAWLVRLRRRAAIRVQLVRLWFAGRAVGQQGMATAEYAIATLGAVAFAGLLVVIMRSDEVRGFLLGIIRQALALP